nr:DUF4292 domain-containing protein [uncultured Carboxylicivirga sp.]
MKNILLIASFFILFVSCKSTKTYYDKHGELRNITDSKLLNNISDNYLDYQTVFYKKFKAEVKINDEDFSFKGNLYIERDSSIIISILKGIEVLRVRLRPDKVEVLDRTKRNLLVGNYEFLWNKFMLEMDFNTIYSILTNQLFVYPLNKNIEDGLKKYKHNLGDDVYLFQSLKEGRAARIERKGLRRDLILHEFYILPDVFKISRTYIKDFNTNASVDINYSKFFNTNKGLFPGALIIKGNKNLDRFSIELSFDDVEFDGESSIGFKISEKYQKKLL